MTSLNPCKLSQLQKINSALIFICGGVKRHIWMGGVTIRNYCCCGGRTDQLARETANLARREAALPWRPSLWGELQCGFKVHLLGLSSADWSHNTQFGGSLSCRIGYPEACVPRMLIFQGASHTTHTEKFRHTGLNRSNITGMKITQGCKFWVQNLLCCCNPIQDWWLYD